MASIFTRTPARPAHRVVKNSRQERIAPAPTPAPTTALPRVLNAVCGRLLARRGSALAMPMSLQRADGTPLEPSARDCALLAGRPVVVFVHGLGCDDASWRRNAATERSYGDVIEAELGHVPLYVRYNTGRSIDGNGARLAQLLRDVWRATRCGVTEIVLVGHSMGGLVARAACAHAARRRYAWLGATRVLVCLGSPHRGATLPKLVGALPGPIARIVGALSAGIRDLEQGLDIGGDTSLHGIPHRYIAGCIAPRRMPGANLLGDGLVSLDSAAPARARGSDVGCVRLYGANHVQLLNEPRVHAHLRRWLRATRLPNPRARGGSSGARAPGNGPR